jgi:hypothetical protein
MKHDQQISEVDELKGKISILEAQLKELDKTVEEMKSHYSLGVPSTLSDTERLDSQLMGLENFIIQKFPEYARECSGSVLIDGLTGNGEIGPDGKPMPNVNAGGNEVYDPYRRK